MTTIYHPVCVSGSVMSDSLKPHGVYPTRLLHAGDSPSKNTRAGCRSLLWGIFLSQGSNLGLLHCRRTVTIWATKEDIFTILVVCKSEVWVQYGSGEPSAMIPTRLKSRCWRGCAPLQRVWGWMCPQVHLDVGQIHLHTFAELWPSLN